MSNYSKITNQDVENTKEEDFFAGMSNENRELFKRALSEAVDSKIRIIEEEIKDMEIPLPSKRHKIRMNRIFRENVGGAFLPFPEADCFYERVRSKIALKLKINELLDKCKNIDGQNKNTRNAVRFLVFLYSCFKFKYKRICVFL